MKLYEIVSYLDKLLEIDKIKDELLNGLEVENSGEVNKICSSVDPCLELVERASPGSLIIIHHGLFHVKPEKIIRQIYKIIHGLIKKDCALYGAHLPLDMHRVYGHNHGFYRLAGWEEYVKEPYGKNRNNDCLTSVVEFPGERDFSHILETIEKILGKDLLVWDFGKKKIKRLAFLSGYGPIVSEPVKHDLDLYITGEPAHYCYRQAKDNKLNMVFAGHYRSEVTGMKLLGDHLSEKYGIEHEFIDLPTGL